MSTRCQKCDDYDLIRSGYNRYCRADTHLWVALEYIVTENPFNGDWDALMAHCKQSIEEGKLIRSGGVIVHGNMVMPDSPEYPWWG